MNNDNSQIPLVLAHIGKMPQHLSANILYLVKTFPKRNLYFISDIKPSLVIDSPRFIHIPIERLIQEWPVDFSITDKRRLFRNNFWFTSKARLILIPSFMRIFGENKVIHIENDVWIHPLFPFYFLEELEAPLSFPRVDSKRGIASVMVIKGELGIRMLEDACASWPNSTDMQILGNLMNTDSRVFQLPSMIGSTDNSNLGNWIFDGAAIGMYLFGADPKNSLGLIRRFEKSPMGSFLQELDFSFKDKDLVISDGIRWNRVAALHIHSKTCTIFSSDWKSVLEKQLIREQRGMKYGFNFSALFFGLREMIHRIWSKLVELF